MCFPGNVGLHGNLPQRADYRHANGSITPSRPGVEIIDLSATSISGALGEELILNFPYLQVPSNLIAVEHAANAGFVPH